MDLKEIRQKARRITRRIWMKQALRGISDNDAHGRLERVYRVTDPWNLESPIEHARFVETNRILSSRFGRVGDLLEIGCGEGAQSAHLQQLTQRLHGIDVSPTAIARARARLPNAHFYAGNLSQQPWSKDRTRFDLIVACEVLYYIRDARSTIAMMNRLADRCFVSFVAPEAHKLSGVIQEIPGVERSWVSHEGFTWLMAWWENPAI
jgi:2-polyprenyl-3-methyl-5-hydroxy-6-metoxy-1,4-benzoquinol methylase